jgi:hypothetical protein
MPEAEAATAPHGFAALHRVRETEIYLTAEPRRDAITTPASTSA